MTIILVLGLFAGLSLLWLLLRLAVYALPLYIGLAVGFWLRACGQGYGAAILAGFVAAVVTLAVGRLLFDWVQSPTSRLMIAALFVMPAGIAGYHAFRSVVGLALGAGAALDGVSLIGAGVVAVIAWRQLGSAQRTPTGDTARLQSGSGN